MIDAFGDHAAGFDGHPAMRADPIEHQRVAIFEQETIVLRNSGGDRQRHVAAQMPILAVNRNEISGAGKRDQLGQFVLTRVT